MNKQTYYHIWCNQNNQYMNSGMNSQSKAELLEGLRSYISIDCENPPESYTLEDILDMWGFSIIETLEVIEA